MKKLKLAFLAVGVMSTSLLISSCTKTKTVEPTVQQTKNTPIDPANSGNNNDPGDKLTLTYTKKTRPILLEITSTGCSGCGSWGKPTFKKLITEFGADITPLAVHIKYGDPFITTASQAIADNRYGSRFTPQIWVNDANAVILSGGYIQTESEQNARDHINTDKGIDQPAVTASIKKENGKLNVTYGAKFIDLAASGDYAIACYLTEDGIAYKQAASASNPTIHNQVLRSAAKGSFGKEFTSSDLADNEISLQHSFDISSYNEANVYVTIVLWRKSGSRYMPINGYVAK